MHFIHSTAYYPELWDDNTIKNDIINMKKLEIDTVRIGEFAWSVLEPNENDFQFERFSYIMDTLYENGINIILCTPTATPPIWMSHNHPERMFRDTGSPVVHGGRQHICTNNPYFRKRVEIIVEKVASILGTKKGVIAWQIDNELKCNVGECFCDECNSQWHDWLKKRYKTIENLNTLWGADVWSQAYQDFSQIPQPFRTPPIHNPSLETNYYQFSHDKVNEFFKLQADIIRKYSSSPITHNSSRWFRVNNDEMTMLQDFTSFDAYPKKENYRSLMLDCDRFRGLQKDGKFMCMETSPGYNGATKFFDGVLPTGFVAAEATAVQALGGIGFGYWHFHQHRAGCELIHGSILSADGSPNFCYHQAEKVRDRIKKLNEKLDTSSIGKAEVAIHYSDKARAFMQTENYWGMEYNSLVQRIYDSLADMQIFRDVIPTYKDVSKYKIVFTPFIYALDDEFIEKMKSFCENGGTWVVGPMTSIRTTEHTVNIDGGIPRKLERILGIKNSTVFPSYGSDLIMRYGKTKSKTTHLITAFETETAEVLSQITDFNFTKNIISIASVGNGKAVLLGTLPEDKGALDLIISDIVSNAAIRPLADADNGIFTVPWHDEHNEFVIAFNFENSEKQMVFQNEKYIIEPYDVVFLEEKYGI